MHIFFFLKHIFLDNITVFPMRQGTKEVKLSPRGMATFWNCDLLTTLGIQEEKGRQPTMIGRDLYIGDRPK